MRYARAPGSALQGPSTWPQLWIQPGLIRQHLDWEKLESPAPFPLKGAGGGKLEPRGDWRKGLGRGAWDNQPTFQLRTGCGGFTGAQVVKRQRNIITRTGAGRSRAGGLRATSLESFPGLSEHPPRPGPRELLPAAPHLDPALRLRPAPLRPRPWAPPLQPCLLSSAWTQSPHPISTSKGPFLGDTGAPWAPSASPHGPKGPGSRSRSQGADRGPQGVGRGRSRWDQG